jgi:hypothetical protein
LSVEVGQAPESVAAGQAPESVAAGQAPESVWCELHSVRLVICDDNRILCVARPTAAIVGRPADVGLLDVDLAGSISFCHATSRTPSTARVIVLSHTFESARILAAIRATVRRHQQKIMAKLGGLSALEAVALTPDWLGPPDGP